MKPTPAQIKKLILDNPRMNIFDLARFIGIEAKEANRIRARIKIDKERRVTEAFDNLKFLGRKI